MELVKKYLPIALIVIIFLQSMPYKFGLIDSVTTDHIFTSVGQALGLGFYETHGGLITGLVELTAVALLLAPGTRGYGGLLSFVIMAVAILLHFTVIGIAVPVEAECGAGELVTDALNAVGGQCTEDDPGLFVMAIIALISALVVTLQNKTNLPVIGGTSD